MSKAAPKPRLAVSLDPFSVSNANSVHQIVAEAVLAEEAGVDRVTVPDHVAFGEHLEAYSNPSLGGKAGAKLPPGTEDLHFFEPATLLATIAGRTTTIRLAIEVLLAALRGPMMLAKQLATLDQLSSGRLEVGVGVGWQREEYESCGVSFDERGPIVNHVIEVCQTVWRDSPASFSDERLSFDSIHQMPKPAQDGGVPIWVGGTLNPRVINRLAKYGTGWVPWGEGSDNPVSLIPRMREAMAAEGREDVDQIRVIGRLPRIETAKDDLAPAMEAAAEYREGGVTDFRLSFGFKGDASSDLDRLTAIVTAFRAAVA
jgi:probable F420-dependent oxidoreductase